MDGARLDRLARTLSSRRTAVGGLLAGLLTLRAGRSATTNHGCRHAERSCTRGRQCCSGTCLGTGTCKCSAALQCPRPTNPCMRATCTARRGCRTAPKPAGTRCRAARCVGESQAESAGVCTRASTCTRPGLVDCGHFRCVPAIRTCLTSCAGPADCRGDTQCYGGACHEAPRIISVDVPEQVRVGEGVDGTVLLDRPAVNDTVVALTVAQGRAGVPPTTTVATGQASGTFLLAGLQAGEEIISATLGATTVTDTFQVGGPVG